MQIHVGERRQIFVAMISPYNYLGYGFDIEEYMTLNKLSEFKGIDSFDEYLERKTTT